MPANRTPRLYAEPLDDRTVPTAYAVNNLSDTSVAGQLNLREAVDLANRDPEPDVITFANDVRGGSALLTQFDAGRDSGELGPTALSVYSDITIRGTGERIARDTSAPAFRLFHVMPADSASGWPAGTLTLENLALSDGLAIGPAGYDGGGGAAGMGGAVFNQGTLVVRGCTLTGNTARGGNSGALEPNSDYVGGGGAGVGGRPNGVRGGAPNGGSLSSGAGFGGGGVGANEGSSPGDGGFGGGGGAGVFTGGAAGGFGGGGGAGNSSSSMSVPGPGGYGAYNGTLTGGGGGAGMGGAIFNLGGTAALVNSTVVGNRALGGATGTATGPTDAIGTAAGGLGGGAFNLNGTLSVVQCTFSDNAAAEGGAVFNLGIEDRTVPGYAASTATLIGSLFVNSMLPGPGSGPSGSEVASDDVIETSGPEHRAVLVASAKNLTNQNGFRTDGPGTVNTTGLTVVANRVLHSALADNGGPTPTLAPLDGGDAVDAGAVGPAVDPVSGGALAFDQRGATFLRRTGARLDLGAVEATALLETVTTVTTSVNPSNAGQPLTLFVTVNVLDRPDLTVAGEVDLTLNTTGLGRATLTNGALTFTSPLLLGGRHQLFASYIGATTGNVALLSSLGQVDQVVFALLPPPDAVDDAARTPFGQPVTISVLANDTDPEGDDLTITATGSPAHGTVAVVGSRLEYTPAAGFIGTDQFTYTITDADAGFDTATVTVVVGPPPPVPPLPPPTSPPPAPEFPPPVLPSIPPEVPKLIRLHVAGAGNEGGPRVRVFNADGSQRFDFFAYESTFRGGVQVATADVDGDLFEDVIVAAGPNGGPRVRVFSGRDLAQLVDFFAYDPSFRGGATVAGGDLDADGRAEVVVGAGPGGGPHVRTFSVTGSRATQLGGPAGSFMAYDPSFRGGAAVAAGDVNGDGKADLVVGAGLGGGPHVRVFDAATGKELVGLMAYDPGFRGGVLVAAGDLDGDGRDEVVTGAGDGGGPHVRVFDRTGRDRGGRFVFEPDLRTGLTVATDGDDVLVGAGRGGGPRVSEFGRQITELYANFFAYESSFRGGVYVG